MTSLWIVHREPRLRAALARLAAAPEDAVRAAPGDPLFDSAPAADVVLLGLAGDLEAELEFAHRLAPRLRDAGWILVAEQGDIEEVRRLFDTLDAQVLGFPPQARTLRQLIRAAPRRAAGPLPLSQRAPRDELRERFTRWFADLELPELLRAVDPRLADVPLLILGEPGTGRGLLARYVHSFGGAADGALAHVPCVAEMTRESAVAAIAAAGGGPRGRAACSVLLEEVDQLEPALQREIAGWIEFGAPEGVLRTQRVRWIGTAADDPSGGRLDPGLGQALSGLRFRIPPLRDRRRVIAPFANDAARRWCAARGERPRRLGEDAVLVLEEFPWPGNLRELEAVVQQTLSAGAGDPIHAADLQHEGTALAPLEIGEVGALLPEEFTSPEGEAGQTEAPEPNELAPASPPPSEPVREPRNEKEATVADAAEEGALRRLAGALAHEVRNPLTSIRGFVALLPERYQDSDFRTRFAELASQGVERIEDVIERLERLASLAPPTPTAVDMEALLAELLRGRRDLIRKRRLLVLKELDSERPRATGDPEQLRFAFEALLNKVLDLVPDRGDIYCASKHHASGLRGGPCLRVLVRYRGPEREPTVVAAEGVTLAENALEFVIAEAVILAQGGLFALDASDGEAVLVVDLPAPA